MNPFKPDDLDELILPVQIATDDSSATLSDARSLERQRIAFWVTVPCYAWLVIWVITRVYFHAIEDVRGDRVFIYHPMTLGLSLVSVFIWCIGLVLLIQNALECKQLSWYGTAAAAMLGVPVATIAAIVLASFWSFFSNL